MSSEESEPEDVGRPSVESLSFHTSDDAATRGIQSILERITDAFVAFDREWRFTYLNRRAEQYFGRRRRDLIGASLWSANPAWARSALHRELRRAALEQTALELTAPDPGSDRWFAVSVYPSDDGVSVYFRDITQQRRAEQMLRESEARFRRLVEAVPEGIWVTDERGHLGYVNRNAAALLGYEVEEMLLRPAVDLVADEPSAAELGRFLARREGTSAAVHELRLRRRDGSELWAQMSSAPLLDEAGALLGALTTVTNINDRKQLEESMRFLGLASRELLSGFDYEARLQRLTQLIVPRIADACAIDLVEGDEVRRVAAEPGSPDGFRALDALDTSGSAARVLSSGAPELTGGAAAGRDRPRQPFMIVPLLREGRPVGAISFALSDGRRGYGTADLVLAQAIAEWAALALDHARLYQDALRAAQARDEVLGIVSHDLRSPLSNIQLSARVLAARPLDPEVRREVDRILRIAQRVDRLLQDLLDVARADVGEIALERERHDLAALVGEAVDLQHAAAAQKSIRIHVDLAPGAPSIVADRHRLLQVFANLLDNAIKHTPEGGSIRVAAELGPGLLRFSIEDSGPGIPPKDLARVFDRFWQAKTQRRAGAGLGLAIAKAVVEAHGGAIWAESAPGRGAAFRFTCPSGDASAI